MTSVYPAPPSVAEISGSGQIGNGEKVVSFTFENCYVGPIFVDTDRDVRAVVDLVQEKMNERQMRMERRQMAGKIRGTPTQKFYTTAATNARSILEKAVVAYIDRAFTLKGIKENTLGRKKTNYPKRSKIIKVDKETGKLIYPEKHPLHKDNNRRPASEAVEMASRMKLEPGTQGEDQHVLRKPPGSARSENAYDEAIIDRMLHNVGELPPRSPTRQDDPDDPPTPPRFQDSDPPEIQSTPASSDIASPQKGPSETPGAASDIAANSENTPAAENSEKSSSPLKGAAGRGRASRPRKVKEEPKETPQLQGGSPWKIKVSTNLFKNRFKPTDTAAAGGGPKPGPKPNTKGPREPYVSLNPPGPTQVQLNRRRDSRGEPPGGGEGLPPRSGTPTSTASSELTVKMPFEVDEPPKRVGESGSGGLGGSGGGEWFARPEHQEKIRKFLEKKKKKQEKIEKILAKRKEKALGIDESTGKEVVYKGMGVTEEEARPKIKLKFLSGKLTKPTKIGGKKKVLKQSTGQVIELNPESPVKQVKPSTSAATPSVSQDTDKDIIANLLETAGKQDSTSTSFLSPQISQPSTLAQTEPLPLRSQKLTILQKRNPVFSKEKDDLLKALDFLD